MTNAIAAASAAAPIRELTRHELELVAGGLDLGPIHVEAGDGLFTVGIGGYGIWGGQGCLGVYSPSHVYGVCGK